MKKLIKKMGYRVAGLEPDILALLLAVLIMVSATSLILGLACVIMDISNWLR